MSANQHQSSETDSERQMAGSPPPEAPSASPRRSAWNAIWFVFKAVEIRLRFILILVAMGYVIGYWDTIKNYWDKWTRPAAAGAELPGGEEFYCPMHPSVVRDKPDPGGAIPKCPICGMPLSKRKKGELPELPEGVLSRVQLSPYRVQLAGIRTVEVALRPLTVEVRAPGYVTVDERRLSGVVVRAAGFVEKLYVNESFAEVREGDPLAEIYSPELSSAAEDLLIFRRGNNAQLVEITKEKLLRLGIAQQEIDEILRTGKATSRLIVRSLHGGHVFEKRVLEGDEIKAGQTLFEVADLSTVWIEGEAYEKDSALLRRGQAVEATVESFPGRTFEGRIYLVHPHVETSTRTMRVRFELDNPGHLLRPGMFATVRLKTPIQEVEPFRSQLAAQESSPLRAIAHSTEAGVNGRDVPEANAKQEPDDESLIALQKICPVTGAKLGSMGKPVRASAQGQTVFLCCAACEEKLQDKPAYYLARLRTVTEEGVLAVPEMAVIDTGNQKIVYVEREPGLFEGVAVTLGPYSDGYYAVIDGLLAGDRVAAAGSFLVDAETRLNPAASAAYFGASGSPSSGGGSPSTTRGSTNGAAPGPAAPAEAPSKEERENLKKLPAADRKLAEQQRTCPITDMPLGSMGVPFQMTVQGKRLFLCCEGCKDKANDDPQSVLAKIEQGGKGQ